MSAGTVVITGGILATVILLCIIAVLCYCRLQYYCCKRHGSDRDVALENDPQPQFACNACSASGVDGAAVTSLVLPYDPAAAHGYCPTCTPYHLRESMRNGGERLLDYMPGHYENTHATALGMAALLSHPSPPDFITNTHAISTDV